MSKHIHPSHLRFAQEYALSLDGKDAAIRAGFSPKTAAQKACELIKRPEVIAEVNRITEARAEKKGIKLERVLEELAHMAFVDPATFFGKKGKLLPIHEMPEATRRALQGLSVTEDDLSKLKFEKRAALGQLLDYLTPIKKLELSGKDGAGLVVQVVNYGVKKAKA